MRSKSSALSALAIWPAFGLVILCLLPVLYSDIWRGAQEGTFAHSRLTTRSPIIQADKASPVFNQRDEPQGTFNGNALRSPAHQNPAVAPPVPIPDNRTMELSSRDAHSLNKRDALRCDNGPCIDGR